MTNQSVTPNGSIFNLTSEVIEAKQQWGPGEVVTIWQGNSTQIQLQEAGRDGGGLLVLTAYHNTKPGPYVVAGTLVPGGWKFSLTERDYQDWARRVKGEDRLQPSINAEAQAWGDKMTPGFCGLSPEATKAVRAAEARRKRYQNNAEYWTGTEWVEALVERWPQAFVAYDGTIRQTKATAWVNGKLIEAGPFSVRRLNNG